MRKERKSRAKTTSNAGRKPVSDPRKTSHLMLYRSEREACDAYAKRLGLGFSPWARSVLLAAVAQGMVEGKLAPGSIGSTFGVLSKAIMLELKDLPLPQRQAILPRLAEAFEKGDEEILRWLFS